MHANGDAHCGWRTALIKAVSMHFTLSTSSRQETTDQYVLQLTHRPDEGDVDAGHAENGIQVGHAGGCLHLRQWPVSELCKGSRMT